MIEGPDLSAPTAAGVSAKEGREVFRHMGLYGQAQVKKKRAEIGVPE